MTKDDIIDIVCEVCEITRDDLKLRSRKEPLPTARALIAHYLYRELRMFPRDILPSIGYPHYSRVSVYHYIPGKRTLIEQRAMYNKLLLWQMTEIGSRLESLRHKS